jgi:NAD(P)-dependent dehydrogenase (short-subunit alcohol dehydrogenase family)
MLRKAMIRKRTGAGESTAPYSQLGDIMGDKLNGKVAVVTGSTAGIGRASVEMFASEGAKVVVNGRRREAGEAVVSRIEKAGGTASFYGGDVGASGEVKKLIDFAVETYGRLDIVMNNAYTVKNTPVADQTEEEWDANMSVLLKAVFLGCKYAIPHMIEVGGGSIVNVSSVHGLLAGRASAPYSTAKAALINLTRQIAVDYGMQGIRANAMCPGRIVTEAKIEFLEANPAEIRRQHLIYPLGRPGTMEEAAKAALFLASDDSSFITGHALVVDGGLTAQLQDVAAAFVEKNVLEQLENEDGEG